MSESEPRSTLHMKSVLPLCALLVVATIVTFLGVANESSNAARASIVMWLTPGLCLTLASGRMRTAGQWLLSSFLVSYLIQVAFLSAAKLVGGLPLDEISYLVSSLGGTFACVLALIVRVWTRKDLESPWGTREDRIALWILAIVFLVGSTLLRDYFTTQDLNDDGLEALYIGESLEYTFLPRWPTVSGLVGLGVGMFAQAFPNHFFVFWNGAGELAPRLPFLLGLPIVLAALFELIETGTSKRLSAGRLIAVTAAFAIFVLVMAYSAGYDAYWCEPSSPGAYEMLLMAFVLGGLWSAVTGRTLFLIAFALLAHLSRPSGVLIFGLFFVASLLFGGEDRKAWSIRFAVAVFACVLVSVIHEKVYTPWVLGDSNLGYDSRSALARFRFLTLTDVRRIAWFIVPCGILPFLSLFLFRAQDSLARVVTAMCGAYAAVFYVPAFVSLHHYVPLMLLPLVVFWRLAQSERLPFARYATPLALTFCAVAAALSWPAKLEPTTALSELGARIVDRRPEAPRIARNVRARAKILEPLIQFDDPTIDPLLVWFGNPWSLLHYVHRGEPNGLTTFLIQRASDPIPPEWAEVHRDERDVLLIRRNLLQRWREEIIPPLPEFAAPLYAIDLDVQFRHRGIPNGRFDIDLRDVLPYGDE